MENNNIQINSIDYRGSICDGPGVRTVIFFQGCNQYCEGCHNKQTWDIEKGKNYSVKELFDEIYSKSPYKKITISGGEPLLQSEALRELLLLLNEYNYDIALYTSYDFENVPKDIIKLLKYIKCGRYIESMKTSTEDYIGSYNQVFINLEERNNKNGK